MENQESHSEKENSSEAPDKEFRMSSEPEIASPYHSDNDVIYPDLTDAFTTQACYTRSELTEWVLTKGRELKYSMMVSRYDSGNYGNTPRLFYSCEKYGKPRLKPKAPNVKRRKSSTKKTNCPFLLRAHPLDNDLWYLVVACGRHNHPPSEYLEGCPQARKLTSAEEDLVKKLSIRGATPRNILPALKDINPHNVSNMRNIYNARQKHRTLEKCGQSQLQYLLGKMKEKNYIEWHRTGNEGSQIITELFFAHPTSIDLLRTFPEVLIIDSTYKTTRYKMTLFEIVGVTSTNITFAIAFVFLSHEKVENYMWALDRLRLLMSENHCALPNIMVTDRELALMKAIDIIFPTASHMLCRWHIEKNIATNTKKYFTDENVFNGFQASWNTIVYSDTVSKLNSNIECMKEEYKAYPEALDYTQTWLKHPYGEKFLYAYTNKLKHFGNNTTNRVESSHSTLKRYLGTGLLTFDAFWGRVDSLLEMQHTNIKASLEKCMFFSQFEYDAWIFEVIRCSVTEFALKIMKEQYDRAKQIGNDKAECGCVIRSTHGLTCACEVGLLIMQHRMFDPSMVDKRWTTLRIMKHNAYKEDDFMEEEITTIGSLIRGYDRDCRLHIIRKIREVLEPRRSDVIPPIEKAKTKGRNSKRAKDNSTKRESSGFEHAKLGNGLNTSYVSDISPASIQDTVRSLMSKTKSTPNVPKKATPSAPKSTKTRNTPTNIKSRKAKTPNDTTIFLQHLPKYLRPFISECKNVGSDGHCGFRAVAHGLFNDENVWPHVRTSLKEEILSDRPLYDKLYGGRERVDAELRCLDCYALIAPYSNWMKIPDICYVIANAFKCIIYTISDGITNTFLPLKGVPPLMNERKEIGIAHVHGNHYISIRVTISPGGPLPLVYPTYMRHVSEEAKAWFPPLQRRIASFVGIQPPKPPTTQEPEVVDLTID